MVSPVAALKMPQRYSGVRRKCAASLVRPVKELKDYCRVRLAPGEEREMRFLLPKQSLGFYDNEGRYRLEGGQFRIFVGGSSRELLEQSVSLRFAR